MHVGASRSEADARDKVTVSLLARSGRRHNSARHETRIGVVDRCGKGVLLLMK
jgi:hypothetical protein